MLRITQILSIIFTLAVLSACGGGSAGAGVDSAEPQKFHIHSDLSFITSHKSVAERIELSGSIPRLTNGNNTMTLSAQMENGSAYHWLAIEIKDYDGLDGQYNCIAADSFATSPSLQDRDCYIRFDHDSFVGYAESWGVGNGSCTIDVEQAVLDSTDFYQELVLGIQCEKMVILHNLGFSLPVLEGADLESELTISGKIFASSDSRKPAINVYAQEVTTNLSVSGGDGIIDSSIQLQSVGMSDIVSSYFAHFESEDDQYRIFLYIQAPYDITGRFECVSPPIIVGQSPGLHLEARECLVTIRKKDEQNILDWVWSSYEGAGCYINVSNARIESSSYPLHELEAQIDCPGMISEAAYRGYNYPGGIVPTDLQLKGNFSSARYN